MIPEVSVILPARNAGVFLEAAIGCILNQSLGNLEVVLINHSSSDNTEEICRLAATSDSRINFVRHRPSSFAEVLNFAISIARAPIVARMDADDLCAPERLELQVNALVRQGVDVVGTQADLIDAKGSWIGIIDYPLSHHDISASLKVRNPICHPSVIVQKNVLKTVGGYRAGLNVAEDLDLWLRIEEAGGRFANLEQRLLAYRQHGAQLSATDSARTFSKLNVLISAAYRRSGLRDPFLNNGTSWSEPRQDLLKMLPGVNVAAVERLELCAPGIAVDEQIRRANEAVRLLGPFL